MTWREQRTRLLGSLRRRELDEQMTAEMQFHLDMATERNVRAGMSPAEARRRALLTFGSVSGFAEEGRTAQRARTFEDVFMDVKHTLRRMARAPLFTATTLLSVALGVGASTAVFSVIDALLLRPVPFPDPDRVAYAVWDWGDGRQIPSLTGMQFAFLRERSRSLEAVATYGTREVHVGDERDSEPVRGLSVSDDFFDVVSTLPVLGRRFDAAEHAPGGAPVVILGDGVWRTRFGADAQIVGQEVLVNGVASTVIGVMPPHFRFPAEPEYLGFLTPLQVEVQPEDEGHNWAVIARVRAGWSETQVEADVRAVSRAFRAEHPDLAREGEAIRLQSHAAVFARNVRTTLWLLFGAVGLVLLIACANTATLLLVRASTRQREIAVRTSLGAGRRRIVQQLLTEGVVLAVGAALLALLIASAALRLFVPAAPVSNAAQEIGLDMRVLLYAFGIAGATALAFGLATALPVFRTDQRTILSGGGRSTHGGSRTREVLVFIETVVAIVLLVGAGLLTASFARLMQNDPGFEPDAVVAVRLGRLPPDVAPERREQLMEQVLGDVQTLPGVQAVAATSSLPFERGLNFPIDIAERPDLGIGATELRFVTANYFRTLGVPMRGGRDFDTRDTEQSERVAIVNEAFARHFWNESSPVGRTIQIGHYNGRWINPSLERQTRVIGVVADMREAGMDRAPKPTVWLARSQAAEGQPILLVRAAASRRLIESINATVRRHEPRLRPRVEAVDDILARSVAGPRFRSLVLGCLALAALLLAGIGIYGAIASGVQQRAREIGIRIALGATPSDIVLGVVRRCVLIVSAGVLVGCAGALGMRRFVASLLYELSPTDVRVYAVGLAVLAAVAGTAAWLPARRAARLDPARALRAD